MTNFKKFINDESGATAIEYGLLAALVAVAGITAFRSLGTSISAIFERGATELDNA